MLEAQRTMYDVIGLGELLWDCFPDTRRPGGAPANVAFHAQQLGLSAAVATRVGIDPLGDEVVQFLQQQGLSTTLVQRDPHHGTGTVTVEPRPTGTTYTFLENSAWDFLTVDETWRIALSQTRAVCFGTLAQRHPASRATIHAAVQLTPATALRVYDINLRPPFYDREWIIASLQLANIAKCNDEEVAVLAQMLSAPSAELIPFAQWLRHTYRLEAVCITRGGAGAIGVSATEVCEAAGIPIIVADTVGAGDAFTAGLIWSVLNSRPLRNTIPFANHLGALVASHPGAMPVLTSEIRTLKESTQVLA
jgi:fructokinase